MPTQVLMPALSPTMEEGKLAKWVKAEGDEVRSGDVIAEIETDKATMEVEAVDEGKLGKILVPAGTEGVKVNTPIAVILIDGEDAAALTNGHAGKAPSPLAESAQQRSFSPPPPPAEAVTLSCKLAKASLPEKDRMRGDSSRRQAARPPHPSPLPTGRGSTPKLQQAMTAPPRSPKAPKWCR